MSAGVFVYRATSSSIVSDEEVKQFDGDVSRLISNEPGILLAIDFSRTFHISSRAIGLLIAFRKKVLAAGGTIVLFGATPAVARVFEVTKINTVFHIVGDENKAVEILRDGSRPSPNGL